MKNNWLITQAALGLMVSSLCAHGAESARPASPGPGLDELGYPTNALIALELGRADATRDVSNGLLQIPMYGLPGEWSSDFSRILAEKYQVQRYGLGGCLVSQGLSEYARGYSEISEQAIKERFGSNFLERVQAEAKQAFDQRIQAEVAATAAAAAAKAVAATNRTYRVKPGDTFWEIARLHRIGVASLVAANPGVNPGKLQINYNLNLPAAARP